MISRSFNRAKLSVSEHSVKTITLVDGVHSRLMKALKAHNSESRLLRPYSPLQGFHGFYGIFRWHLAHAPVMNYVQLERAVFIKRHRKWLVTGTKEIFHVHAIFPCR